MRSPFHIARRIYLEGDLVVIEMDVRPTPGYLRRMGEPPYPLFLDGKPVGVGYLKREVSWSECVDHGPVPSGFLRGRFEIHLDRPEKRLEVLSLLKSGLYPTSLVHLNC